MYFEEIKLNTTIELAPVTIEEEKMLAFARLYDNIPLHTDEEYAKKTIFGKRIAPGVMTCMSVWAKYLEVDLFREELIAGISAKMDWRKPVYASDVLTGTVCVTGKTQRSEKNGVVELTVTVRNQDGETVMTHVTETVVKCKAEGERDE